MSETAGLDVGTTAAAKAYMKQVLPEAPEPLDETLSEMPEPLGDVDAAYLEPG